MRLRTRTKTMLALAVVATLVAAAASAQNLRVMGTTTGEGTAFFNSGAVVRGHVTLSSPDSGIYSLRLERTNEDGRNHTWAFWNMNSGYGQDSLQLYEYQVDGQGVACLGNAADGAMCAPRLTVAKGGNVGIGVAQAAYRLDVGGDVHATGSLLTEGEAGWFNQTYGGGWFMRDSAWIRTSNDKGVWTGQGVLGSDAGLSVGYGGTAPPAGGAILSGSVGIGTGSPASKLDVNGDVSVGGTSVLRRDGESAYLYPWGTGYADETVYVGGGKPTGLTVTGTLSAPNNRAIYFCPSRTVRISREESVTICGNLSLSSTCTGHSVTVNCDLVGRLIAP